MQHHDCDSAILSGGCAFDGTSCVLAPWRPDADPFAMFDQGCLYSTQCNSARVACLTDPLCSRGVRLLAYYVSATFASNYTMCDATCQSTFRPTTWPSSWLYNDFLACSASCLNTSCNPDDVCPRISAVCNATSSCYLLRTCLNACTISLSRMIATLNLTMIQMPRLAFQIAVEGSATALSRWICS